MGAVLREQNALREVKIDGKVYTQSRQLIIVERGVPVSSVVFSQTLKIRCARSLPYSSMIFCFISVGRSIRCTYRLKDSRQAASLCALGEFTSRKCRAVVFFSTFFAFWVDFSEFSRIIVVEDSFSLITLGNCPLGLTCESESFFYTIYCNYTFSASKRICSLISDINSIGTFSTSRS